ncbi:P-loop containing nucleoside triphosphate hydrolase protein [Coniella lustricola]|uniref:P-loop containing nucleoside triphosphate hydrolase protein n=1 Tax=Coniella lustricola TaxID=2025994 RepID=A0A2T3AIX0_9PEZI|nr:P-loop containing nucleoside triphosphate hydrolase protein [Coniella lustricola]
MSTSPEPSPVNGHLSPVPNNASVQLLDPELSDSDLSEAPAPDLGSPSASPDDLDDTAANGRADDFEDPQTSSGEEQDAPNDEDFDDAGDAASLASNGDNGQVEAVSSDDSSARSNRKLAVNLEDEYMRENPELYGLRRSSRPQQRRKILRTQIEDDDSSQSDSIVTNRRATKKRRTERSVPSSKRDTPLRQTPAEDSDSDTYGGARAKSFQKKARRQAEAQPAVALAEKRWNSRRAARVSAGAYQESDFEREDDSDATPDQWAAAEYADTSPYIEKIIRHRLKPEREMTTETGRYDFEYLVKWQGKSHMHNSWETMESVAGFRGTRRLDNYYKKVVTFEISIHIDDEDITPEQKEEYLLDRERQLEAVEDYTKIERVVAVRDGEDGDEYLVKWKGLSYDECTWEAASLISERDQDKIDLFLNRSSRSWQSDRTESDPNTRSPMRKIEHQPSYITNGELREFQLKGLNFLALNWTRANNVILADEMGLGKTVQSVSFLSWLRNDRGQEGPFLVVAPLSVIPAWCDTFNHWAPDLNYVVYLGPESARSTIREHELLTNNNPRKPKFNVLVTSYEYILLDADFLKTIKWQVAAVDEAHRLKNRESQLYGKLFSFNVPCKVLITGTPIQNNLAELSALLDFLNPGKVLIDEELEHLAQSEKSEAYDKEKDEEQRKLTQEKLSHLHTAIAPFIIRRTKETVESDLPPKTEKIIRVELSDVQLEYYKNILTRNYAALKDANGQKQSLLNIMMELKKISNHPYMFHGVEERVLNGSTRREDAIKGLITSSGKMMLLDQLLTKLRKDGHRVLIFSQMVKMLDILGDYLRVRGYQFQRLDGTIPAGPRRMAINHFNAEGSDDFCFLLSTRAGGLGINLMTADTVIIYDSDWNPQADLQAMARAHRIGQKKPVSVYRLVAKQTIEEEVVKRARNKLFLEYLTIQAGVTDEGKALREEFKDRGLKVDEAKTSEDIQMILKMRSQNLFEQSGNQEKLEQLDIDTILEQAEETKTAVDDKLNLSTGGIDWDNWMHVTDVKVDETALDWDQIIPPEQLAVVKAEEEKKHHDAFLAKAREENAPRKATLKNMKNNDNDRADRLAKKRERESREQAEVEERRALLSDPRRPLNEKETRNLIRAFFRYGSMRERGHEVVHESRLTDRDIDFLQDILDRLVAKSQTAVDASNIKVRVEEERTGKQLAKKDKKAVLVDFEMVKKVNAETVLERPAQMRLLREVLNKDGNPLAFRLPEAAKSAHYTCEWGHREDAMLLIGIDRYGFGAWTNIKDDAELNMNEKFFLEEHRVDKKEERRNASEKNIQSPGAVHLVRRSEYLLSVLMAKHSGDATYKKAVENHHRSKKNLVNGHRRGEGNSASASPAPGYAKKSGQARERNRERVGAHHNDSYRSRSMADERGTPRPEQKRKHVDDHQDRHGKHRRTEHGHSEGRYKDDKARSKLGPDALDRLRQAREDSVRRFNRLMELDDGKLDMSSNEHLIWTLLKPVRGNFQRIMQTTAEHMPSAKERARTMGTELRQIGNHLIGLRDAGLPREQLEGLMPQFWDFLATVWPIGEVEVTGKRLSRMYRDLREKDKKVDEDKVQAKRREDLEDGEIDVEEDKRRRERREARREPSEDTRRDYRRDERHRAYENGDRLSFRRDRDRGPSLVDRPRPSWSPGTQQHRHSPY